jgi:hypothetical protein
LVLSRWKCKFEIKFKKPHSKKDSADAVTAEQLNPQNYQNFFSNFSHVVTTMPKKQVYFIVSRRTVSLGYKHAAPSASKKAMDRATMIYCSNISGTDKLKLLVIEKRAKPLCFKKMSMDSLPVLYYANKHATIIPEICK